MIQSITIMGCGYIGLPTAVTFVDAGLNVCGFDINQKVVDMLSEGHLHIVEPGLQEALAAALGTGRLHFSAEVPDTDAYLIAVQTPYSVTPEGKKVSEIGYVENAARMIAPHLKQGNLVILESTVPPLTTRRVEQLLAEGSGLDPELFHTVHCPERILPGQMLRELRENNRIVGAKRQESRDLAKDLYAKVVTKGEIIETDDVTAEMCKLAENTFRDINIAYANELSIVCQRLGIDVFRLIELANCHPRVNILSPGVGVGGHCIAVDPWFIHDKFEDITPLIYAARMVNDGKPRFVAETVAQHADRKKPVGVLGLSFKADIDDLRESPSLELCHLLQDSDFQVLACEPNVAEKEIQGFENCALDDLLARCGYVVITLAHRQFRQEKEKIRQLPNFDCVGLLR